MPTPFIRKLEAFAPLPDRDKRALDDGQVIMDDPPGLQAASAFGPASLCLDGDAGGRSGPGPGARPAGAPDGAGPGSG